MLVTEAERDRLLYYLEHWQNNRERLGMLPTLRGRRLQIEWTGFALHIDDKLQPKAKAKPKEIAGLSGGVFNTFGSLAAITTPIVIGYLVKTQGSFELALLYVGLSAVLALVCYVVVVGPIKRLDIADLEPTARSGQ